MRSLFRRLRGQHFQNHAHSPGQIQFHIVGAISPLPDRRNTEHLPNGTELPEQENSELPRNTTAEERADEVWNGVLEEDESDSRSLNECARDPTRGLGVGSGGAGDRQEEVGDEATKATWAGSDIDSLYASNLPNGLSNGTNHRHVEPSEEEPANHDGDNRRHDVNGIHIPESDASQYSGGSRRSFAIYDNLSDDISSLDTEPHGPTFGGVHRPAPPSPVPDTPTWDRVPHRAQGSGHAGAEYINGTESHGSPLHPRENGISNDIPLSTTNRVPNFSRPLHSAPFYDRRPVPTIPMAHRPMYTNGTSSKTNGFTNGHHYSPGDPSRPDPRSSPLSPDPRSSPRSPAPASPPNLFAQSAFLLPPRALPTGLPSNSEIYRLLRSSLPDRPLTPTTYDYTIATQAKLIRTLHREIDSLNEELDHLTYQVLTPMTELFAECKTTIREYDRAVQKLRQENGMLRDIGGKATTVLKSTWARQWEVWDMVRVYKDEGSGKGKGIWDWLCGRRCVGGDSERRGGTEEEGYVRVDNEGYVREAMEMRSVGNRSGNVDGTDVEVRLRNILGSVAVMMDRNLKEMKAETDEVSSMVDAFNELRRSGAGQNVRGMRDV